MSDDMENLLAEEERIAAMPGQIAWAKLARLNRIRKIFRGNASVLLEHVNRMHNPSEALPLLSNRQAFEEFLDETERHLHNYVAAVQSRVDHLRRFKREDMPKGLREEYQRRVDQQFSVSPLHNFITDLRNLILHVRLPVSMASLSLEPGGHRPLIYGAYLHSPDLLRWDGWSRQAREFIEACGSSVDLRRTVSTYTDEVIAFDGWVAESFFQQHRQDIESYQRVVEEHLADLRFLGLFDDPETP
jgi:hypothetical protein